MAIRFFVSVLLMLLASGQVNAQQSLIFTGAGTRTCGQFAEAYRASPEVNELFYFSWAQGFMSGRNSVLAENNQLIRDLASLSMDEQQSFIRHYCNQFPLDLYYSAVIKLHNSLKQIESRSN
jgi:hypothetical protein